MLCLCESRRSQTTPPTTTQKKLHIHHHPRATSIIVGTEINCPSLAYIFYFFSLDIIKKKKKKYLYGLPANQVRTKKRVVILLLLLFYFFFKKASFICFCLSFFSASFLVRTLFSFLPTPWHRIDFPSGLSFPRPCASGLLSFSFSMPF